MVIETCRPVCTNRCRLVCRQRGRQHESVNLSSKYLIRITQNCEMSVLQTRASVKHKMTENPAGHHSSVLGSRRLFGQRRRA
jgi:hypothetical protein